MILTNNSNKGQEVANNMACLNQFVINNSLTEMQEISG